VQLIFLSTLVVFLRYSEWQRRLGIAGETQSGSRTGGISSGNDSIQATAADTKSDGFPEEDLELQSVNL
jgi:hypothetical protein